MSPEKNIDQYAKAQHELELAWIDQNRPLFSSKATGYFGLVGRGAIIVDAATKLLSEGPLFTYFSKEQMEHIADVDFNAMVDDYDPDKEFVVLLLLPQNQTRAYQINILEKEALPISAIEYART